MFKATNCQMNEISCSIYKVRILFDIGIYLTLLKISIRLFAWHYTTRGGVAAWAIKCIYFMKVTKKVKIRNRYNQIPDLT